MERARLQHEQTKSESVIPQKTRASVMRTQFDRLALNDARSPALCLGQSFGSSHTRLPPGLQAKLRINEPGDQYEQEADRVADLVMRMPDPEIRLQRKCGCHGSTASGESCECASPSMRLQRPASADSSPLAGAAPSAVHDVLRTPGRPLDSFTSAFFEPRFGRNFSHLRVHVGEQAAESARAVNARAYTVGRNLVFGAGEYAPQTLAGQRLLAHELTHTVQQDSRFEQASAPRVMNRSADRDRREPETAAGPTIEARSFAIAQNQPEKIARQQGGRGSPCVTAPGIPSSDCSAYLRNSWWLPWAYVNNATCACTSTPDVPTARCVRKVLQDRLAATPTWLKLLALSQKPLDNPLTYPRYQGFVQNALTPRIYHDHVVAYRSCCCPSGPAPYPAWIGVTTVPLQPCSLVGLSIRHFGSCSGTPGAW